MDNPSSSSIYGDGRADNLSISIIDVDKGADNPDKVSGIADVNEEADKSGKGTNIADADRGADNPGICIMKIDREENNPSTDTSRADGWINDLGTSTGKADRRANNLGTNTSKINGRADEPSIETGKVDRRADNLSTDTYKVNEGANNPGTRIAKADGVEQPGIDTNRVVNLSKHVDKADNLDIDIKRINNLGTNVDRWVNKEAIVSNKVPMSLFFLLKALFILISSFELEIVFASLFITLSSLVTLVKQKAVFLRYIIAKMWIPNLNKALSVMPSVLIFLNFFVRYFLLLEVSYLHLLLGTLDWGLLR